MHIDWAKAGINIAREWRQMTDRYATEPRNN